MARAKHTDRADARRRYRQAQVEALEGDVIDAEDEAPPAAKPAPQRPSITGAFRGAYRRANFREDVAYFPKLLRTPAFLLPLGLIVVGAAWILAAPTSEGAFIYFTYVVSDVRYGLPGFLTLMLAGFLAPRASYFIGAVLGGLQGLAAIVTAGAIATRFPEDGARETLLQIALASTPLAILIGFLLASLAAWYRRMLRLSNEASRRMGDQRRAEQRKAAAARSRSRKPARS